MMLATDEVSPKLQMLLHAIDTLDAYGFMFWAIEACDEQVALQQVGEWSVQFRDFPEELPVLESEMAQLAGVFHEIMKLGGFEDSS